jgi:hypothetical protein
MRGGMNISWGCFLCPHRLDIPRMSPLVSCYHATPEVQTAKWRIPATSHDHVKWTAWIQTWKVLGTASGTAAYRPVTPTDIESERRGWSGPNT